MQSGAPFLRQDGRRLESPDQGVDAKGELPNDLGDRRDSLHGAACVVEVEQRSPRSSSGPPSRAGTPSASESVTVSSIRCGAPGCASCSRACLLGAVMAVMRLTIPRGRALLGVLLYGTLIFGGAFSFTYGHQSQTLLAAAGRRAAKSRVERGRAASARGRRECGRARTSAHSFPLLALA
jgi:hypothetical protein